MDRKQTKANPIFFVLPNVSNIKPASINFHLLVQTDNIKACPIFELFIVSPTSYLLPSKKFSCGINKYPVKV